MVLRPTAHNQSEEMIWDSLKRAIANSSGFQRWHSERMGGEPPADRNLDQLVSRYLRETLETLAIDDCGGKVAERCNLSD